MEEAKSPFSSPKGGYIASGPAKAFAKGSDVEIGIAGISVNQGTDSPHLNRPHVPGKAHFSLAFRIFARELAHELASRALFSGFLAYQAGIGCARVRRSVGRSELEHNIHYDANSRIFV